MTRVDARVAIPPGLAGIDVAATKLPRIALMHTWLDTQTEGWWRMALDKLGVPYDYISTQDVAKMRDLRAKYDVILFGPVAYASTALIVNGMPMWGQPMPWKTTTLTPNLGRIAETDDIRPGLGADGVAHLRGSSQRRRAARHVRGHGEVRDRYRHGARRARRAADKVKVVGSVLHGKLVDAAARSPHGYGDDIALYSAGGQSFKVSNVTASAIICRREGLQASDRPRRSRTMSMHRKAARPSNRRRCPTSKAVAGDCH